MPRALLASCDDHELAFGKSAETLACTVSARLSQIILSLLLDHNSGASTAQPQFLEAAMKYKRIVRVLATKVQFAFAFSAIFVPT